MEGRSLSVKRRELSKKERKRLFSYLAHEFPNLIPMTRLEEIAELRWNDKVGFTDSEGELILINEGGILFPSLRLLQEIPSQFSFVTVDNGAIRYILNGANVFAPGIVGYSSFKKDDVVLIKNLKGTIIAVGIAVRDSVRLSQSLQSPKKVGKVLNNIHYLHDDFWNFEN